MQYIFKLIIIVIIKYPAGTLEIVDISNYKRDYNRNNNPEKRVRLIDERLREIYMIKKAAYNKNSCLNIGVSEEYIIYVNISYSYC